MFPRKSKTWQGKFYYISKLENNPLWLNALSPGPTRVVVLPPRQTRVTALLLQPRAPSCLGPVPHFLEPRGRWPLPHGLCPLCLNFLNKKVDCPTKKETGHFSLFCWLVCLEPTNVNTSRHCQLLANATG